MENVFGIDDLIIETALKGNFYLLTNGVKSKPMGFIAMTYVQQLNEFIITYGTMPSNSGYVFVKDFEKTWDIK